jgi:energy-coupling factor transporter ATP-binding protein EcfA2
MAPAPGGQRQRVAGPGVLADAPVLVLDEPTAHLDGRRRRLSSATLRAAGDRSVL